MRLAACLMWAWQVGSCWAGIICKATVEKWNDLTWQFMLCYVIFNVKLSCTSSHKCLCTSRNCRFDHLHYCVVRKSQQSKHSRLITEKSFWEYYTRDSSFIQQPSLYLSDANMGECYLMITSYPMKHFVLFLALAYTRRCWENKCCFIFIIVHLTSFVLK